MRAREFGTGQRAVVLLHGAPTTPEHLDRLASRLAEDHRVLIPDLPGYGQTAPLVPYEVDRVHVLLEEVIAQRGIAKVAVVGFSGGAYHGLALAVRGKARVTRLISLAGGGDFSSDERAKMTPNIIALRAGTDLRPLIPDLMLSPEPGRRTPETIAEVTAWADATSSDNLANELESLMAAPSLLPGIRALDIPIVVRIGERDQAAPLARCERLFHACRRGSLEKVPGVGHALLLEDFDGTLASVRRTLASS